MKIHKNVQQGSLEWLQLHVGRPTASEFGQLMTHDFKPRTGEMPKTYLYKKVAEAWRGEPLPGFGSWATEQGHIREEEAIPWFEFEFGVDLSRVGFIEAEDGRAGCSPDALIGDDAGLEIKCPESHTHVKYLLNGKLPSEYAPQVHGSLFVSGRKRWTFLSYRRKFPPLVLTIQRDEEIMEKIGAILADFYEQFDAAMEKLKAKARI